MLRMPIVGCAQLGHSQFALEACGSMCLEIPLLYFCAQAALVDAQQLAQHLLYPLVDTPLKARTMSEASFKESFGITGPILIQDINLIATVLQKQNLTVNADELQQHLSTWEHSDDYVMCESDMVTLFTKFTEEKLALPVEDKVVNNSVDAKASCAMDLAELETAPKDKSVAYAMDLAELETALKDKSVDNMHSLSQRVKQLVLENFNNLFLNIVHGVGVELEQEDILKLRDEKITRDLPDIIKEAVKLDTDAIYVTHEDGSEQLVLDLAVLPVKDQEEFRTIWSVLSEKKTARCCTRHGKAIRSTRGEDRHHNRCKRSQCTKSRLGQRISIPYSSRERRHAGCYS
jgi:hypothetical protein